MMIKLISLLSCLPTAWSHGFMTVPASRNLNQCVSFGKDGLPVLEALNNCLAVQDRSSILGACHGLGCFGCMKFPLGAVINLGGGHHTCTPGNHPGKWKIKKNVCGVFNLDPCFVLPAVGPEFKKDDPQVVWTAGTIVEVEVKYILNHAGNYQFRLCLDGSDTDDCFNSMPLKFEDGSSWKWIDSGWLVTSMIKPAFSFEGKRLKSRLIIPDNIECEHCTLNWRWDTALEASVFSNCADITILPARTDNLPESESWSFVSSDGMCLDIPGNNVADGQPLWMWECNGGENQIFTFAKDTWRVTAAVSNQRLCLDAGEDLEAGTSVFLWPCNGLDQQVFGYDADAGSVYLGNSHSDATLCLKSEGAWNGAAVNLVWCDNDDWTQEWGLYPPSAKHQAISNQTFSNQTLVI